MRPLRKCDVGAVLVQWWPIAMSTVRTGSSSVVCMSSQPADALPPQLPARPARPLLDPAHLVAPQPAVEPGAVGERNRRERRYPDARVGEVADAVEGDDDAEVGARRDLRVADPPQPELGLVAQPLDHGVEQAGVLEAVAAAAPAQELLLDGVEPDAGMLLEQHVDVVEGEGAHVRGQQRGERLERRRVGRRPGAGEVGVEVDVRHARTSTRRVGWSRAAGESAARRAMFWSSPMASIEANIELPP